MKYDRLIFLIFLLVFVIMQLFASNNIINTEKKENNTKILKENLVPSSKEVYKEHSNIFVDKENLPKSIIFVIADGTGIGHYTLSYYSNELFPYRDFDYIGLVATHPDDCSKGGCDTGFKKVTDSASSATAYSTGRKTFNGAIGVSKDNQKLETVVEIAEKYKMNTGLIATSTITHATPASFASHVNSRKEEYEIARQLSLSDVDLLFGGGKYFWPDSIIDNFINKNGVLIEDINDEINSDSRVLGLFSDKALPKHSEGRIPKTVDMAKKALNFLSSKKNNFFLMIEESQVDWGGHRNDGQYIKDEMESLSELISYLIEYQKEHPEILLVLTSDHECGGVAIHDHDDGNMHVNFTSTYHTANFVPIWATGPGSTYFGNFLDNTDVGNLLIDFVILSNE